MPIARNIWSMMLRNRWGVLFLLATIFSLAACTETVLDNDSARAIRRTIDTVVLYDTTLLHDTLIVPDTLYIPDTVVRFDTVVEIKTVVTIDTVYKKDTVRLRDTLKIRDTVRVHDTVVKYDTIRDNRGRFSGEGTLFLREKPSDIYLLDSVPVMFDPASLLEFQTTQAGTLTTMELRLIARAPKPSKGYDWGDRTPWLFYLLVGRMELPPSPKIAVRELTSDPREGASGLAIVPHPPADATWFATEGGNQGIFWINRIDTVRRVLYASFKARFSFPQSLAVDSVALRITY